MKEFIPTLLALPLCVGCVSTDRRTAVSHGDAFVVEPKEYVMIQGASDKVWYSGHQLVGIAKRYAQERKIDFNFEGTEKIVWVKPGGRVRADVWFSSGIGQPVLHVAIDKNGKALRHDTGTEVCGTGQR